MSREDELTNNSQDRASSRKSSRKSSMEIKQEKLNKPRAKAKVDPSRKKALEKKW